MYLGLLQGMIFLKECLNEIKFLSRAIKKNYVIICSPLFTMCTCFYLKAWCFHDILGEKYDSENRSIVITYLLEFSLAVFDSKYVLNIQWQEIIIHCPLPEISKENNNLNYDLFWVIKVNDNIISSSLKFNIRTEVYCKAWCFHLILKKKEV